MQVGTLLEALSSQLARVKTGAISDFAYWDAAHTSLEEYRTATEGTFTGTLVPWSAAKLGSNGVLGGMLARMDQGIERALAYSLQGE